MASIFKNEDELKNFLEKLGDYGKYATALWSAELRTSDQLANAIDDALKPHVALMHIGDLRVKAQQYKPAPAKALMTPEPQTEKSKSERKRIRENATDFYPVKDLWTAKKILGAYWSS